MDLFSILFGILTAAAGFYVGRHYSNNVQDKIRLETQLNEKQVELDAFREKVNTHFEKTSTLFNQVSDSYQSLYDHIAKSSNQLCASQTFQTLLQKEPSEEKVEVDTKAATTTAKLKKKLFDANKLYNAHDYRNQLEDDKVVAIDSAKDESQEPALDYAIKEKGTVNHNSLEIEKTKEAP